MHIADIIRKHKQRLEESILDIQDSMGRGGFSSYDSYREGVGRVIGLKLAQDTCDDTLKSLNEEDDDD